MTVPPSPGAASRVVRNCSVNSFSPARSWWARERVEEARRAAAVRRARAEVGHELGQPVEVEQAVLVVVPGDEPDGARVVQRLEVAAEDRVGPAGRDVQDDDVVVGAALGAEHAGVGRGEQVAQHADDRRDAGAGGDEEQLAAAVLGSTNSPWACSRCTSVPGLAVVHEVVADEPVGDGLDGDRDQPVGPRAVGQRVRAPLADAVDVEADAEVLAGHVAGPVGARLDEQGGGVLGLGVHRDDPAAELGAAAQRREEVEEVGGDERAAGGLRHAAQLGAQGAPGGRRSGGGGHRLQHARSM